LYSSPNIIKMINVALVSVSNATYFFSVITITFKFSKISLKPHFILLLRHVSAVIRPSSGNC
jgi:hypothetical protein